MSSTVSTLINVPTFSGQSTYSADFQNILTKASQSDSLQLNALVAQQTTNQKQLGALQQVGLDFINLQSAISSLTTAIGPGSFQGTVADPTIASVNVSTQAAAGVYTLEVTGVGSTTQTVSADGLNTVTDPNTQSISSSGTFTLNVNGVNTTITPTSTSLQSLVTAINHQNLGVSASIVDVGSPTAPDFRLAVQSTGLATDTIQLSDGTNNSILNTIAPGAPATYKVDGLPTVISSSSSTITLAPGVTANILGQSAIGVPTTITVQQTTTATQTALQALATAYNGVVTDLAAQHGQNAGPLQGDAILDEARQVLQSITSYTGSGTVKSLADIGLDLSTSGQMTFNASEFNSNGGSNIQALSQFLGDSTTGFLAAAYNSVDGIVNPTDGVLTSEVSNFNAILTKLGTSITDQASQVNQELANLQKQLAASDATITVLTGQVTYFTDLFFPPTKN